MNIHSVPFDLFKLETEYSNVLYKKNAFPICESLLNNVIGSLYNVPNSDLYLLPRMSIDLVGVLLYGKKFLNV